MQKQHIQQLIKNDERREMRKEKPTASESFIWFAVNLHRRSSDLEVFKKMCAKAVKACGITPEEGVTALKDSLGLTVSKEDLIE